MTDLIIAAVLAAVLGLVIRYIYREKKQGAKCIGCPHSRTCRSAGSDCAGCSAEKWN